MPPTSRYTSLGHAATRRRRLEKATMVTANDGSGRSSVVVVEF